jgi:hypothetical protein
MFISMSDVKEAERIAKAQRIAAAKWLQVDESKVTSPKDMMFLHRVRAAAAAAGSSNAFESLLRDRDVNRLFNDGALYFERPGQ